MIRSALVVFIAGVLTAFHASRVVVRSWFSTKGISCACDRVARQWARQILWIAGVRVHATGLEDIDWDAPSIVVANHQSWFDVFALFAILPGRVRFVAKEELGRIPVFGRSWQVCGHISVDRGDRARARSSLEEAGRRVREDALTVILFPEGTRSPDGELHAFKKGAFILAIETGVPLIPVGIVGSRAVMPKGSFRIRPGQIRIRVGRPIQVAGMGLGDRDQLLRMGREAVHVLMLDQADPGDVAPGIGKDTRAAESRKETKG